MLLRRIIEALLSTLLAISLLIASGAAAQTTTPVPPSATPYPLPPPNILLIYNSTSLALINTAATALNLTGMSFMRAGGIIKYNATSLATTLAPGHCLQWWVGTVTKTPDKPPECAARDRYARLSKDTTYFWVGSYAHEPFRPQLNLRVLTICDTVAGRCAFNLPQGDAAKQSWVVLDPVLGVPLPAGMTVAYDANQLWIGNMTPGTVLTTAALRMIYTVNGTGIVWTPSNASWDGLGAWDGRGLMAGQCLVLYDDASKVIPLLPCAPIAQTLNAEHPWTLAFEMMGPREQRHSSCGDGKPITGPVLCLAGG